MFILREAAPHAAVDAVAEAGHVGDGRGGGRAGERREDEFWRGEFGDVRFEGGDPWGWRGGLVGGCGGHGAEEGVEAVGCVGSYSGDGEVIRP